MLRTDTGPGDNNISSTWGGGSLIDLVLGKETIKIIKKDNLLDNVTKMGLHLRRRLTDINERNNDLFDVRGYGLLTAFSLKTNEIRDNFLIEAMKKGLVLLGCGVNGVRMIPPYIVSGEEIDEACDIVESSLITVSKKGFRHEGQICDFVGCGTLST